MIVVNSRNHRVKSAIFWMGTFEKKFNFGQSVTSFQFWLGEKKLKMAIVLASRSWTS